MGRIRAKNPQLASECAHLLERLAHDRVEREAGQNGIEAVAPGRVRNRALDELHQIDPVAIERLERAEEGAGPVISDEREGKAPVFAVAVQTRVRG